MATPTTRDAASPCPRQEAFAEVKSVVIAQDGSPDFMPAAGRCGSLVARLLAAAGWGGQPRDAVVFREYAPRAWQWLRREVYGVSSESYI
jgi:hypothetical protein